MATILMKEFGKQWSNLSESERKPFDDLALKGKLRPPPLPKLTNYVIPIIYLFLFRQREVR